MTWGQEPDEYEAREQLSVFANAGGTLIDTAAGYGGGAAEELIGKLWPQLYSREEVILCTKAGVSGTAGQQRLDVSRGAMINTLDASLHRLGTDHLDLWLAHTWSTEVPLAETLGALDFAWRTGRARYVGVADYAGWQVARAATLQQSGMAAPVVAAGAEYSLVNRRCEAELLPAAQAVGAGVLAWSPLGRGVLTAKYRTGTPAQSRASSAQFADFVEPYLNQRSRHIVDAVHTAAQGLGCAAAQIALAWICQQQPVAAAILGARTAEQLRALLPAAVLKLPPQICQALAEVSAGGD